MRFITVTIPQNGQNSAAFSTDGLPIAALTHFVASFDGSPTFKLQTLAAGQDPNNASATWIDLQEISPNIYTDADDAGALTLEEQRNFLGIPNEILAEGGNDMFMIPNTVIPAFPGIDATTPTEAEVQRISNQVARLSNYRAYPAALPQWLRIACGVNQTTAARVFYVGVNDPNEPTFPRKQMARRIAVSFANTDADSTYFELNPGEKIVGIETPAAFTTADLTLQTVKPGVDPSLTTDANWLDLVEWLHPYPAAASIAPTPILKWDAAAQGKYLVVGDLPFPSLPQYLRLHGSTGQGAARTAYVYVI